MEDYRAMNVALAVTPPIPGGRTLLAFLGLMVACLAPLVLIAARTPETVIAEVVEPRPQVDEIEAAPLNVSLHADQQREISRTAFADLVMAYIPAKEVRPDPFEQLVRVGVDGHGLKKTAEALELDVAHVADLDLSRIDVATIDQEDRKCLTQAIYYEARNQSAAGQMAVADVVLNRVASKRFPDTICGVVYQGRERTTGCQFSFTCDGSMDKAVDRGAMFRSQVLATAILGGFHISLSREATNYHATYVDPYWAPHLDRTVKIDDHVFYKRGQKFWTAMASGQI